MLRAILAVFAAFFGVRSRKNALQRVKLWQIVVAGLLCAAVLTALVGLLVRYLVSVP
ncbi:DUF2970 domain-containing protein [Chitinibacter sp. SCUT-21]|uniref:DUF2970 domain-containing protein n=1 Tax=Chitinibacter sp. SCUT-21 TaxID=2970891 RepID=UPI0035A66CFB